MVKEFGGRARFVVEDLGASEIATRFGVDEYPAIFVDEALVARPEDFYSWGGPETGKYLPWSELASRRRFQDDLRAMIKARLSGGELASLEMTRSPLPERLPDVSLTDLQGNTVRLADLRGKTVVVELWATWCPPCLDTMSWMKTLDLSNAVVVAIAVESERETVEQVIAKYQPPGRIVMATDEIRKAFGGPPAVPTTWVADAEGGVVKIFYGAPPTLHEELGNLLGSAVRSRDGG